MMTTWTNVSGSYTIELGLNDDGKLIDMDSEKELEFLRPYGNPEQSFEVSILFTSSGSYTPASMYGGYDHMGWDAEGEDIREFVSAEVLMDGKPDDQLPTHIGRRLFDLFEKQIGKADIDWEVDDRE